MPPSPPLVCALRRARGPEGRGEGEGEGSRPRGKGRDDEGTLRSRACHHHVRAIHDSVIVIVIVIVHHTPRQVKTVKDDIRSFTVNPAAAFPGVDLSSTPNPTPREGDS